MDALVTIFALAALFVASRLLFAPSSSIRDTCTAGHVRNAREFFSGKPTAERLERARDEFGGGL